MRRFALLLVAPVVLSWSPQAQPATRVFTAHVDAVDPSAETPSTATPSSTTTSSTTSTTATTSTTVPEATTTTTTITTIATRPAPPAPPARPAPPRAPAVVSPPSVLPGLPSILELARGEVGGPEARYTVEWGWANHGFWCARFVSWLAAHAGIDVRTDSPARLQHLTEPVAEPRPGDLVFVNLTPAQTPGQTTHVAVVESVHTDGTVATIEGNGPDEAVVARSMRAPTEITGFGRLPAPTSDEVIPAPPAPVLRWAICEVKPWICED
ncbi:MAG: CHAP domain-containing protein [Acidimicrobiia bacterium]